MRWEISMGIKRYNLLDLAEMSRKEFVLANCYLIEILKDMANEDKTWGLGYSSELELLEVEREEDFGPKLHELMMKEAIRGAMNKMRLISREHSCLVMDMMNHMMI